MDEGQVSSESTDSQGRSERLPWISLAAVVVIAVGIAGAYFVAQGQERERRAERLAERRVERGTACSALREASEAYEQDDAASFNAAVKEAERMALRALDTSGVGFGRPERIALYLAAQDLNSERETERLEERLEAATEACRGSES